MSHPHVQNACPQAPTENSSDTGAIAIAIAERSAKLLERKAACEAPLAWPTIQRRRRLQETSNYYCHPGRAGEPPLDVSFIFLGGVRYWVHCTFNPDGMLGTKST